MTNGKTLKILRDWDGDKNSMPRMTTIRLQKRDETKKVVEDVAMVTTKTKEEKKKNTNDMMEL